MKRNALFLGQVIRRYRMSLIVGVMCGTTIISASACSTDTGVIGNNGYIRIVNSTFEVDETGTIFTPIPIDVLIDSSMAAPGVAGLAPNSIANGPTGPNGHQADFFSFSPGLHSFVARKSGLTPPGPSFFTTSATTDVNCAPQQYLPRQELGGSTYYTLIISGINPAPTDSSGTMVNTLAPSGVSTGTGCYIQPAFSLSTIDPTISPSNIEEPFSPPTTTSTGNPVLQTGFHLWNAAPFTGATDGTGGTALFYLTDGSAATGPTASQLNAFQYIGFASFLSPSSYVYFTAKPYWLSIKVNGALVYQTKINYQPGEVHTLIMQNTLPTGATTFPLDPSVDPQTYTKVTDILDNKY